MIYLNKEVEKFVEGISNREIFSVLDLACGKGRVFLPLLKKGFKVEGVDLVKPNCQLQDFNFVKKDVKDFKFKKKYDLIISSLFLHFLHKTDSNVLIKNIKKNTLNGGLNLLVCMSNEKNSDNKRFFPSLEELKEIYGGWEIVYEKQDWTPTEEHDNLKPHRHNLIFFLAKKSN